MRTLLDGDLVAAERLLNEAVAQRGRARDPDVGRFFGLMRFVLRREQDRAAAAEAVAQLAFENFPRVPGFAAALLILWIEQGKEAEALPLYERIMDRDAAGFPPNAGWLHMCALLAQACSHFGDARRAPLLYGALLPYAGLVASAGTPAFCTGSVAHFLGLLAHTFASAPVPGAETAPSSAGAPSLSRDPDAA